MPEQLKKSEVAAEKDPSVTKQYDTKSSAETKFADLYSIVDSLGVCMMGTYRAGTGPVSRAMAVSKRTGPDFLFLANKHSEKFTDLDKHKETTLVFYDAKKADWVSITGEATTRSNDDPRIKEIYSKATSVWFGDLKDGVHTGGPEDPRMTLIEVKPKYISYWQREVSSLGFAKEVAGSLLTGGVANPGSLRELNQSEIDQARKRDSALSS